MAFNTSSFGGYLPLLVALTVLSIDAVIEVGMVGAMVGFLHDRAGKFFTVNGPSGSFRLHGKPAGLLVDQGHTSNGAAGTAFVLVGWLGYLVIFYERRRARRSSASKRSGIFIFWVVMTVLSNMLTLAALIYTFVLTNNHDNQSIDITVAAANPEPLMYPLDEWTPENWFVAVLDLPLALASDRRKIRQELRIMRGWRWNLIPLFILGLIVATLAVLQLVGGQRWRRQGDSKEKFRDSAPA